jgi:hypothetical protein
MDVRSSEAESFDNFVRANSHLWKVQDKFLSGGASEYVLLDLLSQDANHSVRGLYAGKILQREFGWRPLGLIGSLQFCSRLDFSYVTANAVKLAQSYGVGEFLDLTGAESRAGSGEARRLFDAFAAAVNGAADRDLADLVKAWVTPDGCAIGIYVYDTAIRVTRIPFLAEVRPALLDIAREAFGIHSLVTEFCADNRIAFFTSGHPYYTQWGMVSDIVLRNNGMYMWYDYTGNFGGHLVKGVPPPGVTIDGMMRQRENAQFAEAFERRTPRTRMLADELALLHDEGDFLRPFWWEPGPVPPRDLAPALRLTALRKLGMADEKRPAVCVFLHCYADAPCSDEQIYRDYLEWTEETLRIAIGDPSKIWVFKTHPHNRGYDISDATDRLRAEARSSAHVVFIDNELSKPEIYALGDLFLTVRGSIALQIALYGKPVLVAGRSPYSDLGFCHRADTREQYETLLTRSFTSLRLTPEMAERARFYLLYDRVMTRIESTILPPWSYQPTGENVSWAELRERIARGMVELDPLAPALVRLVREGAPRTVDPRFSEFGTDRPEASHAPDRLPQYPTRETAGVLKPAAPTVFGREGNGRKWLLVPPMRLDEEGAWFSGAAVVAFFVDPAARDHSVVAQLRTDAPGALKVLANGEPAFACELPAGGHAIPIALPAWPGGREAGLVLALDLRAGAAPAEFRLDRISLVQGKRRWSRLPKAVIAWLGIPAGQGPPLRAPGLPPDPG